MRYLVCVIAAFFAQIGSAQIKVNGIANAASGTPSLAPGTWAALYGNQLAPASVIAQAVPFPTTLGGVQVTVGGKAAPLSYVSAGQINLLIPFELAAGDVPVVVSSATGTSAPFNLTLRTSAPAIFTRNQQGTGEVVAFDANFRPITSVGKEPFVLYATGLGPTNPAASSYATGAFAEPLNRLAGELYAYIGTNNATISYAGLSPYLHAIYQINMTPPEKMLTNELTLSTNDNSSIGGTTVPIPVGANIRNLTSSIDLDYPTAATSISVSAVPFVGTFRIAFDIVPNAKPFAITFLGPGNGNAEILIDPVARTYQATYSVPSSAARAGDFSSALPHNPVLDFLTCPAATQTCGTLPGNIVPATRIDPAATAALQRLPLPNDATSGYNREFKTTGTISADGRFTLEGRAGAFFLYSNHYIGTNNAFYALYVDGLRASYKDTTFTIR